jgi:hypothetical protein
LQAQRAELARAAAQSRARSRTGFDAAPRSEWELTPEEAAARRGSTEACIASVRARAAESHPEVTAIMVKLIERARRTGDPILPVRVDAPPAPRPSSVPDPDHAARASRTVWAFERIFSETCPASLVKFALRPTDPTTIGAPGLDVRIDTTWPTAPTWKRHDLALYAPKLVFDVTLRGEAINDIASFHLVMPPPDAPPTAVRPRSLFVVATATDASVYPLLSARAFDRLYDEIYGLFFRGDPRVPLRDDEDEAH